MSRLLPAITLLAACAVEHDTRPEGPAGHLMRFHRDGDESARCVRTYDGVDPNDTDVYECRMQPSRRVFRCEVWASGPIGCLQWTDRRGED